MQIMHAMPIMHANAIEVHSSNSSGQPLLQGKWRTNPQDQEEVSQ